MRSIRNAAVAGATVVALALGTTTAATAQTEQQPDVEATQVTQTNESDASLSSDINTGLNMEGDEEANGRDIFGSSKDLESQPRWAQALYSLSIIGSLAASIGLIVGPIYNFIVHGQA